MKTNAISDGDNGKFISENKCGSGAGLKPTTADLDIYSYKQERLLACIEGVKGGKRVGLPLQLGAYEQLPLWAGFFESLGFEVIIGEKSSRKLYFKGRHTVASDGACYPAKLIHGHIESLLDEGVDFIFMPCESYNIDEHCSSNHYNCPIVAYYPELLKVNNERLDSDNFIMPYIDLNTAKNTILKLYAQLKRFGVKKGAVKKALAQGFKRLESYRTDIKAKADEILERAEREGRQVIVLAGRPYHLDNEINHGINKLLTSLNLAVLSEDGIFEKGETGKVDALNQWTYNARLYRAADFVSGHENINLVQLVSFGCGLDAITSDEVRAILTKNGKPYTQIKIGETNNSGAVKVKLKSMLAAIEK